MKLTRKQWRNLIISVVGFFSSPFVMTYVGYLTGLALAIYACVLMLVTICNKDFNRCSCSNRTYSEEKNLWICDECSEEYLIDNK